MNVLPLIDFAGVVLYPFRSQLHGLGVRSGYWRRRTEHLNAHRRLGCPLIGGVVEEGAAPRCSTTLLGGDGATSQTHAEDGGHVDGPFF